MSKIHELHPRRGLPACMGELLDVLRRHDGTINTEEDAINILGNIAMVFSGQEPARAAELVHETFLNVAGFYDLPVIVERDRHGKGTMRIAATSTSKPR